MIAGRFDHHRGAAVPNAEALARDTADEGLSSRCPVERDVADDDVVLGPERRLARRERHEPSTRKPLAESIVGIAFERHRDAAGEKRAEALTGRPFEGDADRAVGQPLASVAARDLVAEHRTDGAVLV